MANTAQRLLATLFLPPPMLQVPGYVANTAQHLLATLFLPPPMLPYLQAPGYVANTAQRLLAEEVTRFVHGEAGLQQALKTTAALAPGAGGWACGHVGLWVGGSVGGWSETK